jgi:hypothetical protein
MGGGRGSGRSYCWDVFDLPLFCVFGELVWLRFSGFAVSWVGLVVQGERVWEGLDGTDDPTKRIGPPPSRFQWFCLAEKGP